MTKISSTSKDSHQRICSPANARKETNVIRDIAGTLLIGSMLVTVSYITYCKLSEISTKTEEEEKPIIRLVAELVNTIIVSAAKILHH